MLWLSLLLIAYFYHHINQLPFFLYEITHVFATRPFYRIQ